MLFALDWIKETGHRISSALHGGLDGLTLPFLSARIAASLFLFLLCLAAGIALCLAGFLYYRLVYGVAGAALAGFAGWQLGLDINGGQISAPVVYALLMAAGGFILSYLFYFLLVFVGGLVFFFALASTPPPSDLWRVEILWLAVAASLVYLLLYLNHRLVMSALTGAFLLGLIPFAFSPHASALAWAICALLGTALQIRLERTYKAKKRREFQEQLKKYPYGPGQAYGWKDPTAPEEYVYPL